MSVNTNSSENVVFQIDDMLGLLKLEHLSDAVKICQDFVVVDVTWEKLFNNLNPDPTEENLAQLKQALQDVCVVNGEPARYDHDDHYVLFSEALEALWNDLLNLFPNLPCLEEGGVRVFTSYNSNGDEVPIGPACFLFETYELYEKVLTDQGKAIKTAFGSCEFVTWTSID